VLKSIQKTIIFQLPSPGKLTMRPIFFLVLLASLLNSASSPAAFLTTLFASNNVGGIGGAVYFDLNVTNPSGITLTNIEVNTGIAAGSPLTLDLYTRSGSFTGTTSSSAGWTLVSSGVGIAAGIDLASSIDIADLNLAPGVTGFALHATNFDHRYTNGNGFNQVFSNADLTFSGGAATNTLFAAGTPFSPRIFNGTFTYDVNAVPVPATLLIFPVGMTVLGLARRNRFLV
jgi:hypothetical protein